MIHRLFLFIPAIAGSAKALLEDVLKNRFQCQSCLADIITVGIHVRRGDRAYVAANANYFQRAMDHHIQRLYLLFTNFILEVHPMQNTAVDGVRPKVRLNRFLSPTNSRMFIETRQRLTP